MFIKKQDEWGYATGNSQSLLNSELNSDFYCYDKLFFGGCLSFNRQNKIVKRTLENKGISNTKIEKQIFLFQKNEKKRKLG